MAIGIQSWRTRLLNKRSASVWENEEREDKTLGQTKEFPEGLREERISREIKYTIKILENRKYLLRNSLFQSKE